MTKPPLRTLFVKNAFANVLGGAGAAVFNLLLPALVVRHLGKLEFSVWSLALQVLMYLQLFGFGLQTAITRFIAHGNELNDIEDQRKTVKAGLVLACGFVALAIIAVICLVLFYPLLFSNVPVEMIKEFRICIALLGISAAWQLFALVPMGISIGLHRNIIAVGGQLLVRILSLIVLWIVLNEGGGLLRLSITLAVCGALIVPINFLAIRYWVFSLINRLGSLDKKRFRELSGYCASLAVWNVAMLLVSGIDIVVVGYFDFERVGAYSLAATVISIMLGVMQAVMSPLLPSGTALNARKETRHKLSVLLVKSTRLCLLWLFLSVFFIKFFGEFFLSYWLGNGYSYDVYVLLIILAVANMIRNSAMPYAMLLMAINMQKQVKNTVFIEGIVNLFVSLMLASKYGAFGVAYGTLIGSVAGFCCNYALNFEKTRILIPNTLNYTVKSIVFLIFPVAATYIILI